MEHSSLRTQRPTRGWEPQRTLRQRLCTSARGRVVTLLAVTLCWTVETCLRGESCSGFGVSMNSCAYASTSMLITCSKANVVNLVPHYHS